MGGSTAATLIANAVVPGVLDRYLAKTGFEAQQTKDRRDPDQPENLWKPADAGKDFGVRGIFDNRSLPHSYQLLASQHHGFAAAATGALLAGGAAARVLLRKAAR